MTIIRSISFPPPPTVCYLTRRLATSCQPVMSPNHLSQRAESPLGFEKAGRSPRQAIDGNELLIQFTLTSLKTLCLSETVK